MKYLKKFNEDIVKLSKNSRNYYSYSKPLEGELNELKDFCDTHITYLTDRNFEIDIIDTRFDRCFKISILKQNCKFTWIEIKDYFIPFLVHLSRKYKITFNHVTFKGGDTKYSHVSYDIDDIILEKEDLNNFIEVYPEGISEIILGIEYQMNLED